MTDTILTIPNTLRNWPWPRHCNPHYAECKIESAKWCEEFHAFSPKAQKAFNLCDFNLLASLAFPLLDKEGCRVGCDLMNLFFVIDEHTDVADIETARAQADTVMDALRNPHKPRPQGEWIGGEVARQFWANAIKHATPTAQARFVRTFDAYMDSVVQQAADRCDNFVRDIAGYFAVRRDTIGAKPSFAVNELYLNIPEEVMRHPVMEKLSELCIDMLIVGNDLCSWNVEQARGDDGHNLVTVVMRQFHMDAQEAMDYIGALHDELVDEFLQTWHAIPTFGGPLDREVRIYCDGLGNWVRGNDAWSFESQRYFGLQGPEIERTRKFRLLDKVPMAPTL